MLIDWFTVIAQALNFLILVWLMKRYLYQPILRAIDAREQKIAGELADAAASKAAAEKQRDEFERRNEQFDQQRAALMKQAVDAANSERQRLLEDARKAAEAMSSQRHDALRNDFDALNQAIVRRTQQEVFAIARKALAELAATSLEARMVELFTYRLRELDGPAKNELSQALQAGAGAALVRSAFDLPAEQRGEIERALRDSFDAGIHVRFETVPELIGGLELSAKGRKLAWSIADYVAALEKSVGELLEQPVRPESASPSPSASGSTVQARNT
jgi:F-type H+-transporting ATPase subunit b